LQAEQQGSAGRRRVVVTGVGLICALGHTAPEIWSNLEAGQSGVGPITAFDTTGFPVNFAAEIKGFDPLLFVEKKEARKMSRFIHLGVAAAAEAVACSGLQITDELSEQVGVHIGSGIGGFDVIEREHSAFLQGGQRKISPFFIPATIANLAAGHISIRHNAKGPNQAASTACSSGAHSIGDSFRIIERGDADVMIAGGAEAAITPMCVGGFAAMRALSTRNDDAAHACRPWDKDRDGFVLGEGAGVLVLEELEMAKRRGANILAEIIGYGMSGDAYHITGMAPEGNGCLRAMRASLRVAGIAPEKIDYLNAHATGTPLGDVNESTAIGNLFGEHARSHTLRISSTKSMTGHLLGGAGGLEAGITVFALMHQTAPPTINLCEPGEGCTLNYVSHGAEKLPIEYALSNSFGFGGTNASLVFKRWAG